MLLKRITCTERTMRTQSAFLSTRVTLLRVAYPTLHLLCKTNLVFRVELTARVGAAAASAIRQHGGFLLIHLHFRRRTQRGVTWKGTLLFHFLLLTLLKKTSSGTCPAWFGDMLCFVKRTWTAIEFKSGLDRRDGGDDGSVWHDGSVHVNFLGGGERGAK